MAKHRLGIIGAGAFTDFSLAGYKQYLSELELASITDPKTELAEAMATKYSIPTVSPSVEALLADSSIDVVLVLTPPKTHAALARQALEAGKHVLVEKPIAFTVDEARELIELAQSKNLMLTANLVLRHHPFHQKLHQIVAEETYGQLRQITTTALLARYPEGHWYWDATVSGGFFLNTYCHFLDLFDYVTNQSPEKFVTTGSIEAGHVISASYPNGSSATLNVNVNVTNDQEMVQTVYVFDQAVITSHGWLPSDMTIHPADSAIIRETAPEKLGLYQRILAEIMQDLLRRIDKPDYSATITHKTLLNAVVNPTRASEK